MHMLKNCFKIEKEERRAHATQYGFMCSATVQISVLHLTVLIVCGTKQAAIISAVAAAGRFLDVMNRFTIPPENYMPGMWMRTNIIQSVHGLINISSAALLWYAQ